LLIAWGGSGCAETVPMAHPIADGLNQLLIGLGRFTDSLNQWRIAWGGSGCAETVSMAQPIADRLKPV